MALFNKDQNARPEPPKAQPQPQPQVQPQPAPAPAAPIAAAPAPQAAPAQPSAIRQAPVATAGAYLDSGSKISGKLYFEGGTKIDGQVDGEIIAKESLTIGESAVVTAQIKAASIVVAGKVSGDISATNRIEIRPTAKVIGNLNSPTLVIHEGAVFEGHCSMSAEGSREDRKVTMFPKEAKEERVAQAAGQKA
ncbi:MAG TPA: polymer-forming cytoskeletal protein [Candidatus Binataceae bacterium]|nr:polymer-forming cytoskeletal protein [Candidatus Binataceae bacterium]